MGCWCWVRLGSGSLELALIDREGYVYIDNEPYYGKLEFIATP